MLLVCSNLTAGEFFFINKNGNPSLENVINNDITNESIVIGKTYNVDETNSYTLITSTNDSTAIKFSDDLSVKLEPNTSFSLNTFDIITLNSNIYPEKLNYTNSMLTTSLLYGQLSVINECNRTNLNYISTGQVNIIPNNGKFIIKSEKNMTMVVCMEGTVKVIDRLSRQKYQTLNKSDILVITPQPFLTGKTGTMNRQNIFNNSKIEDTEYTNYQETLIFDYTNVMFIVVNGKTYGLKK